MATLRKWQPARRKPQPRMMSPDRILVVCVALAVGVAVFVNLRPHGPSSGETADPALSARIEAEKTQARAEARRAEEQERARQSAAARERQLKQQAEIFNQRYNTDRTPVGSVGAAEPAPVPTPPAKPQGFSVVTPALPSGQTGGGFREVIWNKPQR